MILIRPLGRWSWRYHILRPFDRYHYKDENILAFRILDLQFFHFKDEEGLQRWVRIQNEECPECGEQLIGDTDILYCPLCERRCPAMLYDHDQCTLCDGMGVVAKEAVAIDYREAEDNPFIYCSNCHTKHTLDSKCV